MNFDEVRRAQLSQIHSPHLYVGVPGIFSDLLKSFQMLKREWSAERKGKLEYLFVPGKTATLVPEFAVEDLPLAELQSWFLRLQWRADWWWWWWFYIVLRKRALHKQYFKVARAGSDGSMSVSASADPGFHTRRDQNLLSKFSNFGARSSGDVQLLIARL